MTGPEQHAATVERLGSRLRDRILMYGEPPSEMESLDLLDELVALARSAHSCVVDAALQYQSEKEAAEARADELQRERDEALDRRLTDAVLVAGIKAQVAQARREAYQLRAALRKIEAGLGYSQLYRDTARAALAGVQADKPYCTCPEGADGNPCVVCGKPEAAQADNKDSA